jgi:acyl-CoA synthetase (AMP-forming)/AMP-acid ligase II
VNALRDPEVTNSRVEDRVRELAGNSPDHLAVVGARSRCTYRDLDRAVDQATTDFAMRGVRPGTRVAWLGRNDIAYVVTALAVRRRGACLAGLNWRDQPSDLRRACELVDPMLLVADASSSAAAAQLEGPVRQIVIADSDDLPWKEVNPDRRDVLSARDEDDCLLYFTSGATGRPKAVLHSYGRVNDALKSTMLPGFGADAVLLIIPPVFHVAGAVWASQSLLAGGTMVFTDGSATILELIGSVGVTHALMVPTLIRMVLDEQDQSGRATPSLQLVAYGTSPITPPLLTRAMARLGCSFTQMYGSTEAGGVITGLPIADHAIDGPRSGRLRSAGRPMPGVVIKVIDLASGADLEAGEVGELVVRTPWVMQGYWHDPEATDLVIDEEGWLHTHDAAHLDVDGYVYISGRLDDVIISGGENVHPGEVEDVLATLPGVADASLVGIPDRHWGEMVAAAVVAHGDQPLTEQQVIDYCRERLAGYKCPRRVVFVDELPRNATGKVIRGRVRDGIMASASRLVGCGSATGRRASGAPLIWISWP